MKKRSKSIPAGVLFLFALLFLVTACGKESVAGEESGKLDSNVADNELKETSLTVGEIKYTFANVGLSVDSYGENAAVPVAMSVAKVAVITSNLGDGLVMPSYYVKFRLENSDGTIIDEYKTDKGYYDIDAAYFGFIMMHQIKSMNAGGVGRNAYYKTKETKEKLSRGKEKYKLVLEFYNPQSEEFLGSMEKEILMGKGAPQVQSGKNKVQFDLSSRTESFESNGVVFSLSGFEEVYAHKKGSMKPVMEMRKVGGINSNNFEKEKFVYLAYLLDEENNLLGVSGDDVLGSNLFVINSKPGENIAKDASSLLSFDIGKPGRYKMAVAVFERDPVKVEVLDNAGSDPKKIKGNSPPLKSGKPYKILVRDLEVSG